MDVSFIFKWGEKEPEADELKIAYKSVFGSPAGRVVLKDLTTSLRLVQKPREGHMAAADERAFNDGRRAVALQIIDKLVD